MCHYLSTSVPAIDLCLIISSLHTTGFYFYFPVHYLHNYFLIIKDSRLILMTIFVSMSFSVGQLKMVMEHVLEFAVCELTKIVEASFDDLLLELTRKEREHIALEEQLRRLAHQENRKGGVSRRSGSENNTAFPSGSEDTRQESRNVTVKIVQGQREQTETTNGLCFNLNMMF